MSDSEKSICLLLPSHWGTKKGGSEYQADCIADYFAVNTNYKVTYLARNIDVNDNPCRYEKRKIPRTFSQQKFGFFWDAPGLYKKLKEIRPDFIIQRVGCAYTGIAAYYCKRNNAKLIWHIASDDDLKKNPLSILPKKIPGTIDRLFLRYGINNANFIVAQTDKQVTALRQNYGRPVYAVIPNFHPLPEEKITKSDKFTVLWIANLKKLKQPEVFIRLAKELHKNKRIEFKMIGRAEDSKWCDELMSEVSKLENLKYLGELELGEVNKEIAKGHLLVNTSVYEGFPNTFIQSWMREVPTLSLNVDPDGVIEKNNLGCYAKNYESLKAYLTELSENHGELEKIGKRAKAFSIENYSMKNLSKLEKLIELES